MCILLKAHYSRSDGCYEEHARCRNKETIHKAYMLKFAWRSGKDNVWATRINAIANGDRYANATLYYVLFCFANANKQMTIGAISEPFPCNWPAFYCKPNFFTQKTLNKYTKMSYDMKRSWKMVRHVKKNRMLSLGSKNIRWLVIADSWDEEEGFLKPQRTSRVWQNENILLIIIIWRWWS